MPDRSLEALGLDDVPALRPLSYPGRPIREPGLLDGGEFLPVTPVTGPPGGWPVTTADGVVRPLDDHLRASGHTRTADRHPILAVGSNACAGQLRHKLGGRAAVPMFPLRVSGIAVGVSGHISAAGYVSASPYLDPAATTDVVVTLLDDRQLELVDGTEFPRYRRALLTGDRYPMTWGDGRALRAAYLYVNTHGVLCARDGTPMRAAPQDRILTDLIERCATLADLFGSPHDWARRSVADPTLKEAGRRAFRQAGFVLDQTELVTGSFDRSTPARTLAELEGADAQFPSGPAV
ncbi:hypothetical protein [Nocardia thailandica]